MTRKQALHKALEALDDQEAKEKIAEIMADMPFTGWSERTIFDTIDQFVIDHGRIPTVTDFKKKGLPPHPVIKLRFGTPLREFLDKYYPTKKLCNSKIFAHKSRDEWRDFFVNEYHKIKPNSAEEYNSHRPVGSPSWATIAKLFEITKWVDWLLFCGIKRYTRKPSQLKVTSVITVTSGGKVAFHVTRDDNGVEWFCDADGNLKEPVFRSYAVSTLITANITRDSDMPDVTG